MKMVFVLLLLGGVFRSPSAMSAAEKAANVAGTWNVTVRMPGRTANETWTIQQRGNVVIGTAKADRGELPVTGTIEGAFFRVALKDGDKQVKVRATVDGDSMDGSITFGVGDAHLWFAKRSTNGKR
jgi:hypothetical protein